MSSGGTNVVDEHGSVVVTLALSVTMLMIVIAFITQTLFQLLSYTLMVREVTRFADVAAQREPSACSSLTDAITVRFPHAEVDCDETPERLVAVVTRDGDTAMAARQVVRIVHHRDR